MRRGARGLAAAFLTAVLLPGCAPAESAHESAWDETDGLYAEIHTNRGRIVARLDPERTPLAVANYVGLAEGTIDNTAFEPGRPFFDGTVMRRVEPGHVIQTGAAEGGRSTGPGYTFPNQIHAELSHDHKGALNFANGGPHTNASQWCITLGDRSYLDGDYIVFGDVVEGMDVVDAIVPNDVVDSVRIVRIGEAAQAFRPDTRSFLAMVRAEEERIAEHVPLKRAAEREWIARNHPEASGAGGGVLVHELARASDRSAAGGPLRVRYEGTRVRYLGHLLGRDEGPLEVVSFGSRDDGVPDFMDEPAAFEYIPGETSINPGLDRILADMAPGDRRVVIVPAELGYGVDGLYPPERKGEPRFVISPNALLAYEVEALTEADVVAGREER